MKLKVLGLGVAAGIVWGAGLFLATAIAIIRGGGVHLSLIKFFYWGYSVTWPGAVIGFCWAFVDALVAGVIFALIYNLFVTSKEA